jgi:hypothetical protein
VLPLAARHCLLEFIFRAQINTTTTYYAEAILNGLCWLKNPVTASISNKYQLKNYFMPRSNHNIRCFNTKYALFMVRGETTQTIAVSTIGSG